MADPTKYTVLTSASLGDTDDQVVRVATQVSATGTTITTTDPGLVDDIGTKLSVPLMVGIKYASGEYKNYVELVEVTAIATGGKSFTAVRGITRSGKDYTDGSATRAKTIPQDSIIEIVHSHQQQQMIDDAIQGEIATGGNEFVIGSELDENQTLSVKTDAGKLGLVRRDNTNDKAQYSNDGTSWANMDTPAPANVTTRSTTNTTANDGELYRDSADSNSLAFKDHGGTKVKLVDDATQKIPQATVQTYFGADGEASDTYAITLAPAPAAYRTGVSYYFSANTANTGAATLNVNSLGAKTIKKNNNQDLTTGDIFADQIIHCVYDGTNMQMQTSNIKSFIGGDGSDGALNVTSGTTTLTDDKVYNYSSINIASGATLTIGGALSGKVLRIKCAGNCTITGTIDLDEEGHIGGTGGAAVTGNSAGNAGTVPSIKMLQPSGNFGNAGAANESGGGGSGATYISKGNDGTNGSSGALGGTADEIVGNNFFDAFDIDYIQDTNYTKISLGQGGAGGAGGGGDAFSNTSGKGGDGGVGGGSIFLTVAGNIDLTSAIINCNGGNGEDGGDGGGNTGAGGGGGAGSGGTALILYNGTLVGSATINKAGGSAGTGGTGFDGAGGDGGDGGNGKSSIEQNYIFN